MARRRFQDPKPQKRGRFWVLPYWKDEVVNGNLVRTRKREKLASAEMPEREVRKIAAEFLRPLNQSLETIGSAMKFDDFVEKHKVTMFPTFTKGTARELEAAWSRVLVQGDEPLFDESLQGRLSGFDLSHVAKQG